MITAIQEDTLTPLLILIVEATGEIAQDPGWTLWANPYRKLAVLG
jgi:hypothetical protein